MKRDNIRRVLIMTFCVIAAIIMIILMIFASQTDIDKSLARNIVVNNHFEYTGAQNAVSAIYLNFRLWDTLFEALVLLVSAVAVISFSRSDEDEK